MKTAVITGITGQDGAYLAQFLLEKGYSVYGLYRRTACPNFWRINELEINKHDNLFLECVDLCDMGSLIRIIERVKPDEIYNLAAQSFVSVSFEQPRTTVEISGLGALNILEAIRIVNPKIRFYQASTSEMFGKVQSVPQNEETPFYPRSPYGVAKLYAHWISINYKESYNIFAASGILFNHESPLRGLEFVTRKITNAVARIFHGQQEILELGNLNAQRDWGYAKDYVQGMWKMLQVPEADNYVLATGRTETIRYFTTMAFKALDINLAWEGKDECECGRDMASNKIRVRINPELYRPAEVELLIGNPEKARQQLQWEAKTTVDELCQMMIEADCRRVQKGTIF